VLESRSNPLKTSIIAVADTL